MPVSGPLKKGASANWLWRFAGLQRLWRGGGSTRGQSMVTVSDSVISRIAAGSRIVTSTEPGLVTLSAYAGCRRRASLTHGAAVVGTSSPSDSLSKPSASVSLTPAAHLLRLLNVSASALRTARDQLISNP